VKNIKRNVQKGFTLIELMIVIAIVAILVALAVPAYQDYAIRAKVTECIAQAASTKLTIEEFTQTEGRLPTTVESGTANFDPTHFCATLTWSGTAISLLTANTGATSAPGATLTPTLNANNKIVLWNCALAAGETRHLPASCRT